MKKLIIKILSALVTLFLVSLISFLLMSNKQENLLVSSLKSEELGDHTYDKRIQNFRRSYKALIESNHLNLPDFYFTIEPLGSPANKGLSIPPYRTELINKLCLKHGHSKEILRFSEAVDNFVFNLEDRYVSREIASVNSKQLDRIDKAVNLVELRDFIGQLNLKTKSLLDQQNGILNQIEEILVLSPKVSNLWPSFHWHGFNNRYHKGVVDFFRLDWGRSFHDGRLIKTKIGASIVWTLLLSFVSIVIIFLIAIPLGVYQALINGTKKDKWITSFLFFWYTVPMFWMATLLIVFLTSDYYSSWLNIFEGPGLGNPSMGLSFVGKLGVAFPHLILPLICMILPSIAYVTQQMKSAFISEMNKEYVMAAKAQGLAEKKIIWFYVLPNALFPIYTILGYLLPALISGSLVVEIIFNIPGMGRLSFDAIEYADWPLLNVVIIVSAILTIVGFMISDVLYYVFDPRIRTKAYTQ